MLIVAGLNLKNLKPAVWDPTSEFFLPKLRAVMVSYADLVQRPALRQRAEQNSLHAALGIPPSVQIYLDNGAFFFLGRPGAFSNSEYDCFAARAKPDWHPIPRDYIPIPSMDSAAQRDAFQRTMELNRQYAETPAVPIIHIGRLLDDYIDALLCHSPLLQKQSLALGGIVPNLLRAPKAMPYTDVLNGLRHVRQSFAGKSLHIFGIGGTATLHLAALFGMDSADSSGWRNRAARGIVQLPGSGDRVIADLGKWRGRRPDDDEWEVLRRCPCPACAGRGHDGLRASGIDGFSHRACHNLWVLLEEQALIEQHLAQGTYADWYASHLDNSVYRPLIEQTLRLIGIL